MRDEVDGETDDDYTGEGGPEPEGNVHRLLLCQVVSSQTALATRRKCSELPDVGIGSLLPASGNV